MRTYVFLGAAAAATAVAAPAIAAEKCFDKATLQYVDCPQPAPVAPVAPPPAAPIPDPAPLQPWSGFYLGGHTGYAWGDVEGATGLGAVSDDVDGFLIGGHGGFQKQYDNNLVLGLEIDASPVFGDDGEARDGELNFLASARARLGFAADQVMPYVTGGVALADWEYSEPGASADGTSLGFVAGGGVEFMASENWMLRAEGLYYFLDDDEALPGGSVEIDDVFVGRAGLSYKF